MTKIAVISLEHTFANSHDLRSAAAHRWARPLYDAIHSQFRTVAFTGGEQGIARNWLHREGLAGWSVVLANTSIMSYQDWKVDQIRDFQANGWEIAFLLDADPEVTTIAQSMGVMTLTLGTPLHWPGWKSEDAAIRPWSEVADTVDTSP